AVTLDGALPRSISIFLTCTRSSGRASERLLVLVSAGADAPFGRATNVVLSTVPIRTFRPSRANSSLGEANVHANAGTVTIARNMKTVARRKLFMGSNA